MGTRDKNAFHPGGNMSTTYKKPLKPALRVSCMVIPSPLPPMANAQTGVTHLSAAPLPPCYDNHHKIISGDCGPVNDGYGMESDTSAVGESGSTLAAAPGSNADSVTEGHGDDASNGTSGSGAGSGNRGNGNNSGGSRGSGGTSGSTSGGSGAGANGGGGSSAGNSGSGSGAGA